MSATHQGLTHIREVAPPGKQPVEPPSLAVHIAHNGVPALQRDLGNTYLQTAIACYETGQDTEERQGCSIGSCSNGILRHVQAKLTIGPAGDAYEQEADRIAEAVLRMPERTVQRQAGQAQEEEEGPQARPLTMEITPLVQRQAEEGGPELEEEEAETRVKEEFILAKQAGEPRFQANPGLEAQIQSLRGTGQPLAASTRAFFEPRFGQDFSQVRVHTDPAAAGSARALNAVAYTVGRDVVFGAGQYSPGTREGQRLLAHELVHVIQQEVPKSLADPMIVSARPSAGILQRQERRAFSEEEFSPVEKAYEEERSRRSCIDMALRGLTLLLPMLMKRIGTPPVVGGKTGWTMDTLMARMRELGLASRPMEFEFLDSRGRRTRGTTRPSALETSVGEQIMKAAGPKPGLYLFGLSILNGVHSALLAMRCEESSTCTAFYMDQRSGIHEVVDIDAYLAADTGALWDWWLNKSGIRGRSILRIWPIVVPLLGDYPTPSSTEAPA